MAPQNPQQSPKNLPKKIPNPKHLVKNPVFFPYNTVLFWTFLFSLFGFSPWNYGLGPVYKDQGGKNHVSMHTLFIVLITLMSCC